MKVTKITESKILTLEDGKNRYRIISYLEDGVPIAETYRETVDYIDYGGSSTGPMIHEEYKWELIDIETGYSVNNDFDAINIIGAALYYEELAKEQEDY